LLKRHELRAKNSNGIPAILVVFWAGKPILGSEL